MWASKTRVHLSWASGVKGRVPRIPSLAVLRAVHRAAGGSPSIEQQKKGKLVGLLVVIHLLQEDQKQRQCVGRSVGVLTQQLVQSPSDRPGQKANESLLLISSG